MKRTTIAILALACLMIPLGAMAMEGMDHGKMEHAEHGAMEHGKMEHGDMMKQDGMIMLGDSVEDGVKGMAHLKDVGEAMAKMGMKETHHFMIMFTDAESGEAIETGSVAVKVKNPAGVEGKAVKLMGMQGHFGADISLTEKGMYHFKVGTKLKDGNKRQYHFHYTVK